MTVTRRMVPIVLFFLAALLPTAPASARTSPPSPPVLTGTFPASPANANFVLVEGTAADGTTVGVYANGSCGGGQPDAMGGTSNGQFAAQVQVLDNSMTTFSATATDGDNQTSDCSPTTVTYVEDSTAPFTSIDSGPSGLVSSFSAHFTFSSEAGATFQCALDAEAFAPCTSPDDLSSLDQGQHTFTVKATDAAGNTEGSPPQRSWTVDTVPPPVPVILSQPADPTNQQGGSIEFSDSEQGLAFRCSLDDGGFSLCSSPQSLSSLADGAHTFTVRGTDGASNSSSASAHWTVDTVPPTVSAPAQTIDKNTFLGKTTVPVRIAWDATDDLTPVGALSSTVQQRTSSGGVWSPYSTLLGPTLELTATASLTPGANGHQLRVSVADQAGNVRTGRAGPPFGLTAIQESSPSITYVGTWAKASPTTAFGGSVRFSKQAGATARLSVSGRSVGVVMPVGPQGGTAKVCLDPTLPSKVCSTVRLSRPAHPRVLVFARNALTGTHAVLVTVVAGRVDLDAIVVLP